MADAPDPTGKQAQPKAPRDGAGKAVTPAKTPPETPGPEQPPVVRDAIRAATGAWQAAFAVVAAIAVGLAVAVVVLALRPAAQTVATNPANQDTTAPSTPTTTAPPTPIYFKNYIQVNPTTVKPGVPVVEIHDDYQCPWCARAEQIYGDALGQLSATGDIDLRIHLRTMVGDAIIKNDSSERAAQAAACANQVGAFWTYHSTVFRNQPAEGVGFTDEQLRTTFATQAGITGDALATFQSCYDTKASAATVTAMEQEASAAGVNGTPAFFVNGLKANFDLQSGASAVTPISTSDLLAGLQQLVQQQKAAATPTPGKSS
ncbi:MAG: DsbA family protein [Actinomycetia bacterium]|nr:DsbA family protein [Actinomycetes bacterium]